MRITASHLISLCGLVIGMLLALPLVAAEEKPATPKAAWQVGMMKDPKGNFGYCMMRAPYSSGLSLAVALSPKQEINLGIGVPKGGFGKEEKHQIIVGIDKIYKKGAVALAADPELLIMPMSADKDLMSALRKGKMLILTGREDESRFSLAGIGKALDGLKQCVDVGTGKIKAPAAPPAQEAKAEGKKPAPGSFPPALKNMLLKAGVKDLQVVAIKDPSKAPVDFAWRTQGVFGGMRERPVPAEATIEKMSEVIEKGYKSQCQGMFANKLGTVEDIGGVKMRTAEISCQMKEGLAYVSLFFYLTDTHLFTLFLHETSGTNKDKADAARDSIAAFIRQLAAKEKK